jgi:hypothetical protein
LTVTASRAQLQAPGELKKQFSATRIHTRLPENKAEKLFVLMMLGDDRAIKAVSIADKRQRRTTQG